MLERLDGGKKKKKSKICRWVDKRVLMEREPCLMERKEGGKHLASPSRGLMRLEEPPYRSLLSGGKL